MKKGFVLIEVLIAMCIFMIIITEVSSLFVNEYRAYMDFCEMHKEKMSMYDTLSFIENIIKHSDNYEVCNSNKIIIYERDGMIKEVILRNKKIQILSKCFGASSTVNTISQNNILSFQVENYGDYMIYITIQSDKGEKYLRCI